MVSEAFRAGSHGKWTQWPAPLDQPGLPLPSLWAALLWGMILERGPSERLGRVRQAVKGEVIF